MKLKYKITLFFSFITAIIAVLINVIIYYYTLKNYDEDYRDKLLVNSKIVTDYLFEEDEIKKSTYKEIVNNFNVNLSKDNFEYYIYSDSTLQLLTSKLGIDYIDTKNKLISNNKFIINDGFDYHLIEKYIDNQGTFLFYFNAFDIDSKNRIKDMLKLMIYENIITFILIFIIGFIFSHFILKPFNKLINEIESIKANDLKRITLEKSKDEIYSLSNAFNKLLDRIRTSIELQHNFISHASHEFKNPLTTILGETEWVLQKERKPEEYKKSINNILLESSKLEEITNELFKLADASFKDEIKLDDNILLNEILIDIISENQSENVKFELNETNIKNAVINGNYELMKIAIGNIIDNCIKFSDNPLIKITIAYRNRIIMEIEDNGVGIPEDQLKYIYNPFFRASNVVNVKGFGIGMPLTKRILDLHNFDIEVKSSQNKGTIFKIYFN